MIQDNILKFPNKRSVTRVMSFTSGKGGVGKTNTVLNMAIALGGMGRSVLVLDADLGLSNIDILLGLTPRFTIDDVLRGECTLEEVMVDGPNNISIIPAASGIESITSLNITERYALLQAIEQVAYNFDYLLIDTAGGIGADVMHFNAASGEVVCVINGEPTSLTDAYALIKVLAKNYGEKSVSVIANNVTDSEAGLRAFKKLARSVDRFLQVHLHFWGTIPRDGLIEEAVQSQRALMEIFPSSAGAMAISSLARKIDAEFPRSRLKGGMQLFFKEILEMNAQARY